MYLEKMERKHSQYHFFLRPRRFGKSLAVSVMEYYYGIEHKADFDLLFGKYYIGQNPTPLANSYLVLKFDFSGILTSDIQSIAQGFTSKVRSGIESMMGVYRSYFDEKDRGALTYLQTPNEMLDKLFTLIESKNIPEKIFLLIDEYDHFTNEIIAFNFDNFQNIVSRNGIVRKFFEVVKTGTQSGIIDRIFITGVSPVTLDSLTSGFNIGDNLSLDLPMHDFMGFTEEETARFLSLAGIPDADLDATLADLRSWYNGYLFNEDAQNRLYNPDMVLYFVKEYDTLKRYPRTLLDTNISSDYGKIRRMFSVGNESGNYEVLEGIIRDGTVSAAITRQFSFEKTWTRDDFISLIFYMGLLTIEKAIFTRLTFRVPNHVIWELYFRYFQEILLTCSNLSADDLMVLDKMVELASNNNIHPLIETLETVLQRLSNRDARNFDEKYVKVALLALLVPTGVYSIFSEYAIGQEYADIVMFRRPPILEPKHQYVLELKYLKKSEAKNLGAAAEEGRRQLRRYLDHPDIARHGDMVGYLLVFVGYEAKVVEEMR